MASGITTWLPRSVRLLGQFGAAALKKEIKNGQYIKPMISKRIAANIRKRAIVDGTFGQYTPGIGGWDPEWDEPKGIHIMRPHRGHLRERTRNDRVEKIDKAMQGMPDRLDKYKKEAMERKPKKTILYMFQKAKDRGKKRWI